MKVSSLDEQDILILAEAALGTSTGLPKWRVILVDEFQDLNLSGLSLLKNLSDKHDASLLFTGDHRQRIYRTFPSFRDAGIPIVGRSFGLTANYRNTPEIYAVANSLYGSQGDDPDGDGKEDQEVKLLRDNSRKPVLCGFATTSLENEWLCEEISRLISNGVAPGDIAIVSLSIGQSDSVNWEARFPIVFLGRVHTSGELRR